METTTHRPVTVAGLFCGYAPEFGPGLGHWQDLTDDGYRRARTRILRTIEDIEAGDLPRLSVAAQNRELAAVEQIIDVRSALAECWGASDDGTDRSIDFELDIATGIRARLTERGPSYGLAAMFDYERHLRGESTVLDWEQEIVSR